MAAMSHSQIMTHFLWLTLLVSKQASCDMQCASSVCSLTNQVFSKVSSGPVLKARILIQIYLCWPYPNTHCAEVTVPALFLHLQTSHVSQANSASEMVVHWLNLFQTSLSTATCFHRLRKEFFSCLPECYTFNTSDISIWLYPLWSTASTRMARSCTSLLCLQFLRFVELLASKKVSCTTQICLLFLAPLMDAFQRSTVTYKDL